MLYFNLTSLLLFVCGAAVLGLQLPGIEASARVYPLVLIVLVVACSLIVAAREISGRATTEPLDPRIAKILSAPLPVRARLAGFVATWLIYAGALSAVGFLVATTCAIFVSLWLLRIRSVLAGLAVAATFSLAFSILFATVLFIPTPSGPLDQLLTQTIYAIQHRGTPNDH